MDGATVNLETLRDAPTLDALTVELASRGMTPGWIPRDVPILWKEPNTPFKPAHWRYDEAKAAMDGAARLIDTEQAERRNLILRNPVDQNDIATARTLINAYQTILPGETARSHRHAPHALRVILDSHGAYSVVNGDKHPMETGDVVLTPGWHWHGHGHDGQDQAYWLDGLDVPLTHLLEPMFFEDHPDGFEPVRKVTAESPYRFPWEMTLRELDRASPDPDGYFGTRVQYDTSSMPSIGVYMVKLDSGQKTRPYRASINAIYCPMQGEGVTIVDGQEIRWEFGDTFVVPNWRSVEHHAKADTILFCMSDEPLMRFAKYYRFEGLD